MNLSCLYKARLFLWTERSGEGRAMQYVIGRTLPQNFYI